MKNHKIVIAGSTFMIRSDVTDDRIHRIETYINDNLDQIRGRSKKVPFTDALVLVLFKLADTLMDGEVESKETVERAAGEARAIRAEIDEIAGMIRHRLETMDDGAS